MEQQQASSFKVLEIFRVPPSPEKPTSAVATSFPFTFFDKDWVRFPPINHVYFYEFHHPPSSFFDSVLPKLKHSLSLTLHNFLPLAGNITWPPHSPKPILNYNSGDAVSFIVAESNTDNFNHLSGFAPDFSKSEETRMLIPHLINSDEQASVIAFQVTLFPNSGFTLGVCSHHIMDGQSGNLFMKAWSYICLMSSSSSSLLSLPENLTPFFDRSVLAKKLTDTYENLWLQGGPSDRSLKIIPVGKGDMSNLLRGSFELSPSSIQNLKKSAELKLNKKEEAHISTFSVVCGYVLECLVKAEKTEQNKVMVVIPVDCRSRLDPPLPPTYFGNCLDLTYFVYETKSLLGDDGFVCAVEGISEALKKFEKGEISTTKRINSSAEIMHVNPNLRILGIVGSPRLGIYKNDFGWGRPKKVEMVSRDDGGISFSESRSGDGGVEIGVALKEPFMKAFASIFLKGLTDI